MSSQSGRSSAISVSNLTFSWDRQSPVLCQCQLTVPKGQFWMLLGANGSGKSTLFQLLSGLIACPAEATVEIERPVGYVFQNPDRQLVMPSVGADVAFGLAAENLSQTEVRHRVESALKRVGLLETIRRPVYALSGGQKHRVAIAGALARNCPVLLLDEPTALLDRQNQQELVQQIRTLVDEQGITALWITHRLDELAWADGALWLSQGQMVAQGHPTEVRQQLAAHLNP